MFIKADEEAKKDCLPEKKRVRKSLRSRHPDVATREAVNEAKLSYDSNRTVENDVWRAAQQQLFSTYDKLKEAEHGGKRYSEWHQGEYRA